ncbi:hypothetical protein KPA97_06330, partial [Burkholderia cenocepacia]|nr:hypothetical protein [Burkholderia cenocepacia]
MRAEAALHQRAERRKRIPREPAALAMHAFGERHDEAAELQHVAEPLLAPHQQRLAGKRLALVVARQPQRDREVVAQRRPAGVDGERRAVRRDRLRVMAGHLQHVAVVEVRGRARLHARRAFGERERVGRALPGNERGREPHQRVGIDRMQMGGGG